MSSNPNNTSEGTMDHCTVPLAQPSVHAAHPFRSDSNHEKLLKYLKSRLLAGKSARDLDIPRFVRIDKNVAGWMKLSDEDAKRDQKQGQDGSPAAKTMNLPLSFVHLDDMMTYFAQTFAPNRGMFYHTGSPSEVGDANQIVVKMNNDAIYSGFYREVLLGMFSFLKYNRGGYHVQWAKENGPKLIKDSNGQDQVDVEIRHQGNRLEALDMYNFLADPTVHPTRLHSEGEYAGTARLRSYYWLQSKANQGIYFNCERALSNYQGATTATYYKSPPREASFDSNSGDGTDWVSILSEAPAFSQSAGFELVELYIRINPTEFGLVEGNAAARASRNRYEIWRFTVLDDKYIIDASYMNNIHGYLPYFMGLLNDDLMGAAQKSTAEILTPLQDFASFLLNIHVASSRSAVWGLTAFDPTVIDLNAIPKGEVNATIPVKPGGYGKNINEAIWKHSSALETKQTLQDLEAVMNIINQFFPTQSLPSQIASIDRAVTDQVAAVQQGANRRQQKAARLLDDSVFRNVRFAMYYNIIQYMPDTQEITDFYSGKPITLNLSALRNTNLPFIIGQGLKSLDRQAAVSALQQIIFALIQAPQAAQGVDLLALIDYWTSMMDIDIDMKQFRLKLAGIGDNGGPPLDDAAGVDAGGNPIQPATAPAAVTAPIYKGPSQ